MSIMSAICAEADNKVKDEWVRKLKIAIENNDMEHVKDIVEEMDKFYFSE